MINFGVLRGGGLLALYVSAVFVTFLGGTVEAQQGDQNDRYSMMPGIESSSSSSRSSSSSSSSNKPSADRNARLERRRPVMTPIRSQRVPLFPVEPETGNAPFYEGTRGYYQPPQPNPIVTFPDRTNYYENPHSSFVPEHRLIIDEPNPPITFTDRTNYYDNPYSSPVNDNAMELPENMDVDKLGINDMRALSDISTIEEFARTFDVELPIEVAGRFGSGDTTSRYTIAESASCEPEKRVVRLVLPIELNVMYFPRCVRLQRCGGCCTGPLLKCQPKQVEPVTLQVLRVADDPSRSSARSADRGSTSSTGRNRRTRTRSNRRRRKATSRYYSVTDENHVSCSCRCKIQEKDCTPDIHDYMANECQCQCKNRDEKAKCSALSSSHYWDPDTCKCYCHKAHSCSTGQYFDHSICSCKTDSPIFPRTAGFFGLSPRFGGPVNPTPARDYETRAGHSAASVPITF